MLGYSALASGAAMIPAALAMLVAAPISALLIVARGSQVTLLAGYTFCALELLAALVLWKEGSHPWQGRRFFHSARHRGRACRDTILALVDRVRSGLPGGMASETADLQRDLDGAIIQSILGAILAAGYAASFAVSTAASPQADQVSSAVETQLLKSYAGAADVAAQYPQYSTEIIAAA